ncbi:MAG: hypothetical protein A3J24_08655 [Deltaproteobacteria bacterium RIFCSPLOWO2_02_FULL_53_8]|nr:MAG: hypothetical protein A3J24_08655 [Deltaproteobacteria bacterium RIFCSPLOWO2_02_FULL_53_8]
MNYVELLSQIRDIVLTITGIVGSFVAVIGLGTWRRQLYGQSEYDIAKRLLKSLYLFREVMNNVRHPIMLYSAVPDIPKEKLETLSTREREWYSRVQAFEKRWEPMAKVRAELDTNVLESEVFWGNKIKDKMQPLRDLQAELLCAIQDHLEGTNPVGHSQTYSNDDYKRNGAIMYGKGDRSKDLFLDKMLTVIEGIEAVLKPCIKKRDWIG